MSSAVYITFSKPVELKDWLKFCAKNFIVYSPHTSGQNVFYRGGFSGIEIHFGDENYSKLPELDNGRLNFEKASPYGSAKDVTVSSFHGENLAGISDVAKLILKKWHGHYSCDIELSRYMKRR